MNTFFKCCEPKGNTMRRQFQNTTTEHGMDPQGNKGELDMSNDLHNKESNHTHEFFTVTIARLPPIAILPCLCSYTEERHGQEGVNTMVAINITRCQLSMDE